MKTAPCVKQLNLILKQKMEDASNTQANCPSAKSVIVDGMVTIQAMNEKQFVTFNDLGKVFLKTVLNSGRKCQAERITIVFDTYKPH